MGQERRTSGANARCGEAAQRIFNRYGTTKEAAEKLGFR
jgi:hypothetical protein